MRNQRPRELQSAAESQIPLSQHGYENNWEKTEMQQLQHRKSTKLFKTTHVALARKRKGIIFRVRVPLATLFLKSLPASKKLRERT